VTVRALIFDFDGLLVDTEAPALRAWEQVLAGYGVVLPVELWHAAIGTQSSVATVLAHLEGQVGPVDRDRVRATWWAEHLALVGLQPLCAGVSDYLTAAAELGLRLAVASSATADWVDTQLRRVGVHDRFAVLSTVDGRRPKPAPDVYLAALDALGVGPDEAVAFEDSPNGVAAARAAGLRCVAVPNEVTARLPFAADLVLPSFTAMPLAEVLVRVAKSTYPKPTLPRTNHEATGIDTSLRQCDADLP
jgi:beta-phosphoglucomutase-like phosphatase (HAD superfamily)